MTQKHKWEWAKGGATGQKRCVNCGIDKFPGHAYKPVEFWFKGKLIATGKTPPCSPADTILDRHPSVTPEEIAGQGLTRSDLAHFADEWIEDRTE